MTNVLSLRLGNRGKFTEIDMLSHMAAVRSFTCRSSSQVESAITNIITTNTDNITYSKMDCRMGI